MGQAKRRKAAGEYPTIASTNPRNISVVTIHEAGHAFDRFMTAELMGLEPEQAVVRIDMHHRATATPYMGTDGRLYYDQATTYGPFFSREINAASDTVNSRYATRDALHAAMRTDDYNAQMITVARAAGADIDQWALAKVIQALAGPVVEAKATRKPLDDVLESSEAQNDIADIARVRIAVGWSEEQILNIFDNAIAFVQEKIKIPAVWTHSSHWRHSYPRKAVWRGASAGRCSQMPFSNLHDEGMTRLRKNANPGRMQCSGGIE